MVKKTIYKNILKNKNKMNLVKSKKAQVSIEMIVILSVLILATIVLASVLLGFFSSKTDQATDVDNKTEAVVDDFLTNLSTYDDGSGGQDANVTSTPYTLSVSRNGTGTGIVTSFLPGIDCGTDCS
jgi:uncharacterized protein (UPF0333 family)